MTINDENTPRTETSPEPGHKNDGIYRVAGFWTRLLAFTADILVIAALNSIIWNALSAHVSSNSFIYKVSHVNSLFLGIIGTAYFIIMTRYYQQTLGKMILGIKVIQRSGKPLSWITVVFRELVARTLSQLMGLNLGYIVCWFNSEKRCAHDYL
ncbi:MAG TPA: RDD family protein, partial [Syntrophomonas sp.]|nr:RDD family protein [Syntrophomonas sp.]